MLDPAWLACSRRRRPWPSDTEGDGAWSNGRDRLLLVQIAIAVTTSAAIPDCARQRSPPRLQQLMENPAIEKVFHFARFDVAALGKAWGLRVNPLFCTKVPAAWPAPTAPATDSRRWFRSWVAVELDQARPQEQVTGRVEELGEAQLAYAANDVPLSCSLPVGRSKEIPGAGGTPWSWRAGCFACIPVSLNSSPRFGSVFRALRHRSPSQSISRQSSVPSSR